MVGAGLSYKAIGAKLRISVRTVERHVHLIADRLTDDGLTPYRRVQRWAARTLGSAA